MASFKSFFDELLALVEKYEEKQVVIKVEKESDYEYKKDVLIFEPGEKQKEIILSLLMIMSGNWMRLFLKLTVEASDQKMLKQVYIQLRK